MTRRLLTPCLLMILFSMVGCESGVRSAPRAAAAPARLRADRIVGTLSLRDGMPVPAGTQFEIIVQWGHDNVLWSDSHELLVVHALKGAQTWPARFEIPIPDWPRLPPEGKPDAHKSGPATLTVFARGASGGRQTWIALPQSYGAEDAASRRLLHLTLIPAME